MTEREHNYELIRLYQLETNIDKKNEYRNKLLLLYIRLLNRNFISRHHSFTNEDIRSFALFGLIKAFDLFKPDKGAEFETFAFIKISGAIKDHQKREGNEARNEMNRHKKYEQYIAKYREENDDQAPPISEVRRIFGHNFMPKYRAKEHLSFDNSLFSDELAAYEKTGYTDDLLDRANLYEKIYLILSENKKQLVMFFHLYIWGTKHSKIASIFGVAESRISQLNKNMITRLKKELEDSFIWE